MVKLLASKKNKNKMSVKNLLFTIFVCISIVAWLGLTDLRADVDDPEENKDEIEAVELNASQTVRVENLANEAVLQDRNWETEDQYNQKIGEYTREILELRASGMGWGDIVHKLNEDYGLDIHPSALGLGHSRKSSKAVNASKHAGMQSEKNRGRGLASGHSKDNSSNRGGGRGGGNGGGNGGGKGGGKK